MKKVAFITLLFLLVMVWAYAVKFSIEKEVTMEQDIKALEETVEELQGVYEVNDSLRDRVVEQNAQIEGLQNKISIQEEKGWEFE